MEKKGFAHFLKDGGDFLGPRDEKGTPEKKVSRVMV
jgi:hypothetical protein